jgi:hypothetical protein
MNRYPWITGEPAPQPTVPVFPVMSWEEYAEYLGPYFEELWEVTGTRFCVMCAYAEYLDGKYLQRPDFAPDWRPWQ